MTGILSCVGGETPNVLRLRLVALGASGLVAAGCGGQPSLPTPSGGPGVSSSPSANTVAAHHAELLRGSLSAASLDLSSGATTVNIRAADLPDQLLTVTTPLTSAQAPAVAFGRPGVADVELRSLGASGGPTVVDVVLARSVRWTVDLDGGATDETIDLRRGLVHLVDLSAGTTRATVELPAQSGTQVVREEGGVSELTIDVPNAVSSRVHVGGGASTVRIGAVTHNGVGGGTTFAEPGFAGAPARLDVDLLGGASRVEIHKT
jgi:hypothetical protein